MPNFPILVLITAPSVEVGQQIAHLLVEKKLAACVNLLPAIQSTYIWEDKLVTEAEVLLLAKTRSDLFEDRLVPAVKAVHPYEVPEIIAVPIEMGLKKYLDWVEASTR